MRAWTQGMRGALAADTVGEVESAAAAPRGVVLQRRVVHLPCIDMMRRVSGAPAPNTSGATESNIVGSKTATGVS